MTCSNCKQRLETPSPYCPNCGKRLDTQKRGGRTRGNGQGCAFKRGKTWTVIKTVGYRLDSSGKLQRLTRSKGGFRTKREALAYLPQLEDAPAERIRPVSFADVYSAWEPTHQASKSTINCYRAAYKYFEPVHFMKFADITIDDLQECVSDCDKGKRTRENMKALCGLLYKYAIPRNLATLNMGQFLVVGGGDVSAKEGLPDEALQALRKNVGLVPGADYILCQCYLGFRPSEFLALDVKDYNREERAFVGGAKTDAGKNRVVTVSPVIQPIVNRLVKDRIAGPVFCSISGGSIPIKTYRTMFYSALESCGIVNPIVERDGVGRRKYTPHSCRHTFATLMKRVGGSDKDKLELMGHTSAEMLRHYQDVSYSDLRRITDQI